MTNGSCRKNPPKGLNLNVPIGPELRKAFAVPSDSPDPDFYQNFCDALSLLRWRGQ